MKISKSKVTLAAKIKSSGFEWPQFGKWATQDKDGEVFISGGEFTPVRRSGEVNWCFDVPYKSAGKVEFGVGWFQCILSRAEYFHLYPAPDAKPEFCESVMRSIPGPEAKPTIEQLSADYRNAKDYAERKQQEADAAKADADAKMKSLELAGEANGLLVTPITSKQEPELVIAVQVGDEVECVKSNIKRDKYNGMVGRLRTIDESDTSTPYLVDFGGEAKIWCHKVEFIRRP
jgi:hypothetical protein